MHTNLFHIHITFYLRHSILYAVVDFLAIHGIVTNCGSRGVHGVDISPDATTIKGRSIQMQRDSKLASRITNLMISKRVVDETNIPWIVRELLRELESTVGLAVPTFPDTSLENTHPTTVTRMIVNR